MIRIARRLYVGPRAWYPTWDRKPAKRSTLIRCGDKGEEREEYPVVYVSGGGHRLWWWPKTVDPTPDVDGGEKPAEATKDLIFEYEAEAVQGQRFEPNALGIPGMWKITTPRRATLKKQRAIAAKKSAKVADLQVLAALAWAESSSQLALARKPGNEGKKAKYEANATALRTEARDALRRAYAKAGEGKADEVTLKLLSVAEITLGDQDAAIKAYTEIANRFPAQGASNASIWLAHLYLKAGKLGDAGRVVDGWKLGEGFNPMGAYVWAWTKYRQRNYGEAVHGMSFAATHWKSNAGRRAVLNELVLFLGRSGKPASEAKQVITAALGDAAASINPEIVIHEEIEFFTEQTAERLLGAGFDCVVDAIDSVKHKCFLIASCRDRKLPVVVCGGAGGKQDPTAVNRADLAFATNDRLLKLVRKRLRAGYDFPPEITRQPFGMRAVFSTENAKYPWADGSVCDVPEPGSALKLDCESGFGTAAQVTGTFGFAAAAEAIREILEREGHDEPC